MGFWDYNPGNATHAVAEYQQETILETNLAHLNLQSYSKPRKGLAKSFDLKNFWKSSHFSLLFPVFQIKGFRQIIFKQVSKDSHWKWNVGSFQQISEWTRYEELLLKCQNYILILWCFKLYRRRKRKRKERRKGRKGGRWEGRSKFFSIFFLLSWF